MDPRVYGDLLVFSGTSSPALGKEIAKVLKTDLGKVKISRFSDGEIYVRFAQSVRGMDIFLVQSLCNPINDIVMELLVMIDALKRASASRISAVIPYYGYSRQDKKTAPREPISAKLIADMLSTAGIDRMITMDLHAGQIQGFFDIPVDHLTAIPILAKYFKREKLSNLVVVSPDVGRVKVAKKYADSLRAGLAILHKTRPVHNQAEVTHIIGEVKGKTVLLIDDMIDTAGTMVEGVEALIKAGVVKVYACATHPVFSPPAVERLEKSPIIQVVVTNTIPVPEDKNFDKLEILSIAGLFGQAISNVHEGKSISSLFKGEEQL